MHENRLILHLKQLTRREMTRFREFAFSPYFNKHEGVRQLVSHLSELYPGFDERNCDRHQLHRVLFPKKKKHDQAGLALLFTYAMRLFEQYLAQEGRQREAGAGQLSLLSELRQRAFSDSYERILKKSRRRLAKASRRDAAYYRLAFRLADEADTFYTLTAEKRQDRSLEEKEACLDVFYIAEKLRDACEIMIRSRLLRVDHESSLLQAVLREVEARPEHYAKAPPVRMYYRLYCLLTRGRPEDYERTRQTLEQTAAAFSLSERKLLYNYLQNFCIQRINQGRAGYLREVFLLYQTQLEAGLLIEEGRLSEWHYKNIVTTGIRLREMDWVRRFIEDYRPHLHPEVRDNAYRFNLASLHHARGEYDEVLALLTRVEYDHPRYNLGAKALLLRTYYETGEYEALQALVSSFRQYLRRNRLLADFRRSGYANLFRFTRRAAAIREAMAYTPPEKSCREVEKLKQRLRKAEAVFNKGWLEEKVEELGQSV